MRNQLLRDTDWASMAHSVEVRTPLVDPHLWRALGGLNALRTHGSGKRLLAAAPSRELPRAVIERHKTGFATPLQDWLDRGRPTPRSGRLNLNTWARRFATTWLREPVGA
jgi:asparagine synthase (glutamine-hydrolysing)